MTVRKPLQVVIVAQKDLFFIQIKSFGAKLLNTDKKIKTFLRLPNKEAFEVLFKLLEKKAPKIIYRFSQG